MDESAYVKGTSATARQGHPNIDALMIDEPRIQTSKNTAAYMHIPQGRSGCDPFMIKALTPDEGSFDLPTRALDCNGSMLVLEPELTSYDCFLFPGMDNYNWFSYKSTAFPWIGRLQPCIDISMASSTYHI